MFCSGAHVTPSAECVATLIESTLLSRTESTGSRVIAWMKSSEPTT